MAGGYEQLIQDNLKKLYDNLPNKLEELLPAQKSGDTYSLKAFGGKGEIDPGGITLDGAGQTGAMGIILSLYAIHAKRARCVLEPFKAYKDFPGTMPYVGAFTTHTENIIIPHAAKIEEELGEVFDIIGGKPGNDILPGDFSLILYPLPKIALAYVFYRADDEFSASVKCLFSNNADLFLPLDALADVGEYTSKKIIEIIS